MAGAASTANLSMILTPHAWLTGSRPGSDPRQPPQLRRKACITGVASHLSYVPDTTCHIEWGAGDYGTAIANLTTREAETGPSKVKSESQEFKESMGSEQLDAKPDTRPSNNKNKTLLHTSKRPNARIKNPGGFFGAIGERPRYLEPGQTSFTSWNSAIRAKRHQRIGIRQH